MVSGTQRGLLQGPPQYVKAVDDVSLAIREGETLGIVGESGCGKSTLARTMMRLIEPTEGTVLFQGQDLTSADKESLRRMRRDIQIIFQDPLCLPQSPPAGLPISSLSLF